MPSMIPCPRCGRTLRVPETSAPAIGCPACGHKFTPRPTADVTAEPLPVAIPEVEPADDPEEAADRPKKRRKDQPDVGKSLSSLIREVRSGSDRPGAESARLFAGLSLLLVGIAFGVLSELIVLLVRLAAPYDAMLLAVPPGFLHWLLALLGLGLCAWAATTLEARWLALATLAVSALQLFLAGIITLPTKHPIAGEWVWHWSRLASSLELFLNITAPGFTPGIMAWLGTLTGFLELVRWALLAVTLRFVAVRLKAPSVALHCLYLVIGLGGGTLVLMVINAVIRSMIRGTLMGSGWEGRHTMNFLFDLQFFLNAVATLALMGFTGFLVFQLWNKVWKRRRKLMSEAGAA